MNRKTLTPHFFKIVNIVLQTLDRCLHNLIRTHSAFFQANLEVQFPPEVQELGEFKAGPGDVAMLVAKIRAFPGLATKTIFSVYFLLKIIDLSGGQINDPSSGKHFFSVPPSNTLVSVSDPRRAF